MARTIPLSGVRGAISRKMCKSLAEQPQLSYLSTVDARALMTARERLRIERSSAGIEDIVIKVLAGVLGAHPEHNGWVKGKEAVLSDTVHMGVAVAVPGGLMVPVIRDVQEMDLTAIARERKNLVARAAAGKLSVADMSGGTFTLSNLGQSRVEHFTPILNTPEIALLGLGCIVRRPWMGTDGELEIRPELGLSLTADHRVVDGWPSAQFLSALVRDLETLSLDEL